MGLLADLHFLKIIHLPPVTWHGSNKTLILSH